MATIPHQSEIRISVDDKYLVLEANPDTCDSYAVFVSKHNIPYFLKQIKQALKEANRDG